MFVTTRGISIEKTKDIYDNRSFIYANEIKALHPTKRYDKKLHLLSSYTIDLSLSDYSQ